MMDQLKDKLANQDITIYKSNVLINKENQDKPSLQSISNQKLQLQVKNLFIKATKVVEVQKSSTGSSHSTYDAI
jgi:hypothetical protein